MAREFKLRHVNELAGSFVLVAVALVVAGVVIAGRAQHWFMPVTELTLELPEAGSLGLQRGATVLVLGTSVGTVDDIAVTKEGRMVATVRIRRDFMRFVGPDSIAVIRKTLGVGDAYVELTRGRPAETPTTAVKAVADEGPTQAVAELTGLLRSEAVPTFRELREGLKEYTRLAVELRDPNGPLQQSLARASRLLEEADAGQGLAGRLLHDRQMAEDAERGLARMSATAEQAEQLVGQLRESAGRLPKMGDTVEEQVKQLAQLTAETRATLQAAREVLKNLDAATTEMPETAKAVKRTMDELPGLVLQANETMRQTERLVEAMQRNWLISPTVAADAPQRLSPGGAGGR